jgi:hypothetical protein
MRSAGAGGVEDQVLCHLEKLGFIFHQTTSRRLSQFHMNSWYPYIDRVVSKPSSVKLYSNSNCGALISTQNRRFIFPGFLVVQEPGPGEPRLGGSCGEATVPPLCKLRIQQVEVSQIIE